MRNITTIIIGAGQAGLAMSHHLTKRGVDHVLLERGEVAHSWRTERWDSLRLLTPNWQSRLPGFVYSGPDPHGFRTMSETVGFLAGYAESIGAPVQTGTTVISVYPDGDGYKVITNRGDWRCRCVVIASGACNIANVPELAKALPADVRSVTPMTYRNTDQLPDGGVLVVGASATGIQLAQEIHRSGRDVTLAVGEHVRAVRTWRGKDIKWWMDRTGVLDQGLADIDDPTRVRDLPSMQLIGSPSHETIDLNRLQDEGVRIVGRLAGLRDGKLQFSGALANLCRMADLKLNRLLSGFDDWIRRAGLDRSIAEDEHPTSTHVEPNPALSLDLEAAGIRTVVWATGYRPDYSWLDVPVLDRRGLLRHTGGVVDAPGLYALGLPFLRKRKSTLIDGIGDDAGHIATHLSAYLADPRSIAA